MSCAPALVVITMITWRKSVLRPLLSVSVPWSITCSSRLNTSGCAFSISSSSSTQCGCLVTASVSRPPWSKPDVAGRRADQARHRVALHVLGHVEAQELDAQRDGELARDFGLADAGGTGKQEAADRLALIAQTRARHLDRGGQRLDRRVLAEDHELAGCARGCAAPRGRRSTRSSPECARCAPPRPRSARDVDDASRARRRASGAAARRPRRPRRWPCPAGGGR